MKYRLVIAIILIEGLMMCALFLWGDISTAERRVELASKERLVRSLLLTDLSVWTEARYTRNPSQTDIFSAFQDFPSSIEHFPAGSVVSPPRFLEQGR